MTFADLGKLRAGFGHNVTRVLVELGQRHACLIVGDEPCLDDGLGNGSQSWDDGRRHDGGAYSDSKARYDIAAFEQVLK